MESSEPPGFIKKKHTHTHTELHVPVIRHINLKQEDCFASSDREMHTGSDREMHTEVAEPPCLREQGPPENTGAETTCSDTWFP